MRGISRYARWVLALSVGFALFAGGWFLSQSSQAQPYQVTAQYPRGDGGSLSQPAQSLPRQDERPESLLEGEVIDVNTADSYDLQRLPGIGEKRAQAIVDYRRDHGPFQTAQDLLQVSGIGPATLEKMLPYITPGEQPDADTGE